MAAEVAQVSRQRPDLQPRLAEIESLARIANAGQHVPIAADVLQPLVAALQDPSLEVRLRAVDALTGIGTGAEVAVPALVDLLQDRSQPLDLRRNAVLAIRSIYAGPAVEPLHHALSDADRVVRSNAAGALGSIREKALQAVPQLILLVRSDPYGEVRGSAAEVLARIDPGNQHVWAVLNEALQDPSWRVRRSAADALAEIGEGANVAVPNLLEALENQNYTLRTSAAKTLGTLGPGAKNAIPDLMQALLNNDNAFAQGQAAAAIGKIGTDDPAAWQALIRALNHPDAFVRSQAFEALHRLADSLTDKLLSQNEANDQDLGRAIQYLENAQNNIGMASNGFSSAQKQALLPSLRLLQAKRTEKALIGIILLNPGFWAVVAYFVLHFGLFWLRPLWLLRIDESLKPFSVKLPFISGEISARFLVFLKFRSRVLDAWVATHIHSVQEEFQNIENVEARKFYIPSPATIDGRTVSEITNKDLEFMFNRPVLIWGEGGVGKTSLACQIGQWGMADKQAERLCHHQMLPILIEEDLDADTESSHQALLDAILGQLKLLTNEEEPISGELLERLLRRRRILVIVDHLSEMNEQTRRAINPDKPDFPINALIVTSRQKEILGQINKLTIKPLRIMGNRLSSFMEAYLVKQGKRDLFTDSEFFDACSHLSHMVGQREVTAMLATLYAKQMISAKVEAAQDVSAVVSDNIPDLMLSYLNQLNKELTENKTADDQFDDRTIHKDAMLVAWACVQELFRPGVIRRQTALDALAEVRGNKAEAHLRYLEERLGLVQTIGASQDQLRFSLDPLAEYLAALHLVELHDGHENQWLDFLAQAEAMPDSPVAISGFLGAVQDCWLSRGKETRLSPYTMARLAQIQSQSIVASASVSDPTLVKRAMHLNPST